MKKMVNISNCMDLFWLQWQYISTTLCTFEIADHSWSLVNCQKHSLILHRDETLQTWKDTPTLRFTAMLACKT